MVVHYTGAGPVRRECCVNNARARFGGGVEGREGKEGARLRFATSFAAAAIFVGF